MAVMTSGCTSNINLGTDDDQTPEQSASEVQTEPTDEEFAGSDESTEHASTVNRPQPAPQAAIRGSALGDGKYLLNHQGGDDLNLAEIKMTLSSHGYTDVYFPICENDEIMNAGDKMVIDIYSGIFTINGNQITATDPETTEGSTGTTNIKLLHIDSGQMIADLDMRG